jgi:hypothetical protein
MWYIGLVKLIEVVDGLNQNPTSNEEDTTRAHWHGDINSKAIP